MRRVETIDDIQIVLRELLDFKSKIETSGLDLHGLRVRNASDGSVGSDYVTLNQLNANVTATKAVVDALASLKGLNVVVHFAGGFTISGAIYNDLVFVDGVLKQLN